MSINGLWKNLLSLTNDYDSIYIESQQNRQRFSKLTRVTYAIMKKLAINQKKLLFTLPRHALSPLELVLLGVIDEIMTETDTVGYDLDRLVKEKQTVQLGDAIFRLKEFTKIHGDKMLVVEASPGKMGKDFSFYMKRVDNLPTFQMVETNRPLSPLETVEWEFKRHTNGSSEQSLVNVLKDSITHLNHSVLFVTPLNDCITTLLSCTVNDLPIRELIYIVRTNETGEAGNVFPGQHAGTPAVVLAKDLYDAEMYIRNTDSNVDKIYIDFSTITGIQNFLPNLDQLIEMKLPVIIFSDFSQAFHIDFLKERSFLIWWWRRELLTSDMISSPPTLSTERIQRYNNHRSSFRYCNDSALESSYKLLQSYQTAEEFTGELSGIIETLNKLIFFFSRQVYPLDNEHRQRIKLSFTNIDRTLNKIERFESQENIKIIERTVSLLRSILVQSYISEKCLMMEKLLLQYENNKVCVIIANNINKADFTYFWEHKLDARFSNKVDLKYVDEYLKNENTTLWDVVIITAWFNRSKMERVLFEFSTNKTILLLYEFEKKWQSDAFNYWHYQICSNNNKEILRSLYNYDLLDTDAILEKNGITQDNFKRDDYNELEEFNEKLRQARYQQNYGSNDSLKKISAIPVTYHNNSFGFYNPNHDLIAITDLILGTGNAQKIIPASTLKTGDFVVFRTTNVDIIQSVADSLLDKDGYFGWRSLATSWKKSIERMQNNNYSTSQIISLIKTAGSTKSDQAIRNWIVKESMISPDNIEDLEAILIAANDFKPTQTINKVFKAGKIVSSYHIKAGHLLSLQLKEEIGEQFKDNLDKVLYGESVDTNLVLKDIGEIMILRVVNIDSRIQIEQRHTNKLISEERD